MTNKQDESDFLNNKRGQTTHYNELFNMESNNSKQEFGLEPGFSIFKKNEDFIAPISSNNYNLRNRESNYGGDTLMHNQSSTNFFNLNPSSSPLVPNRGLVSYYPTNDRSLQVGASPNRSITNSKSDGADFSSSENITTPSQHMLNEQHNTITLPDNCAPKLQNIVSTVNLKCPLDLRDIALKAKNAEYNPKRFAAVIMRIREPKTTSLIFASGKMVCTGARSEEDSKTASKKYAKIMQKLGYNVKFAEFKIQNIVGSCDVKFPIRLEGLHSSHSKFCSYEPEMFPGLIYKMADPKIVLLIFVSGKIVLTGAKVRHDIFRAFEKIYPVLINFKKNITTNSDATANIANINNHSNFMTPRSTHSGNIQNINNLELNENKGDSSSNFASTNLASK